MGVATTQQQGPGGSAFLADARSGHTYLLGAAATLIGRQGSADIALDDPYVSREHARILVEPGGYWFEDLDSANGSFLNNRPVGGRAPLAEGDEIALGGTKLRFGIARQAIAMLAGGVHG